MYKEEMLSRQQLEGDNEGLREQLSEAHETTSHLTSRATELQDKWEDCSVLLKEAQVRTCMQSVQPHSHYYSNNTMDGTCYIP